MASKKKQDQGEMAEPQQKAKPVPPPEDGPRPVSPMSFFNDPRMKRTQSSIRDFGPNAKRVEAGGEGNGDERVE